MSNHENPPIQFFAQQATYQRQFIACPINLQFYVELSSLLNLAPLTDTMDHPFIVKDSLLSIFEKSGRRENLFKTKICPAISLRFIPSMMNRCLRPSGLYPAALDHPPVF